MLRRLAVVMRGPIALTCTGAIGRGATNRTVITTKQLSSSSLMVAMRVAKVACLRFQSNSRTRAKTSQTQLSIISNSSSNCSRCLTALKTPPHITIGILACKISILTTRASLTIANSRSSQISSISTIIMPQLVKISNSHSSRAVI